MDRTTNRLLLLTLTLLILLSACKRPPLPPPIVFFDQAHGQMISSSPEANRGLAKLQAIFIEQGFVVQANSKKYSKEGLENVAALIISGPKQPFSAAEVQALFTYLNEGGQICLMVSDVLPVGELLARLGVAIANGVVRERQNIISANEKHFSLVNLPKHPLTKDITSFNVYGAWPLKTALEANIIAKTSRKSWVDLNGDNKLERQDAVQSFPVLITGQIGHGHFVVFGDDTLFEDNYLTGNNEILGRNLARWFKEGSYY